MRRQVRRRAAASIDLMSNGTALATLESRLGYRFLDRSLLQMALTHRSWVHETGSGRHYERIEFLGDAVLGIVASEWLYRQYPSVPEGRLSKIKSHAVSEPVLAGWARDLGLGEHLRLGVGEDRSGGRDKPSLLADAMEAVLGALYLEGGLEPVRSVLNPLLESALSSDVVAALEGGSKSKLQEWVQSRGLELPEYRHVAEEGPDHDKRFHVECWIAGDRISVGAGATKKRAEQRAARAALRDLSTEVE